METIQIFNYLVPADSPLPHVKVLVQNTSDHPVRIHPKKILAELHLVDQETSLDVLQNKVCCFFQGMDATASLDESPPRSCSQQENDLEPLMFDFGDSPISPVEGANHL